MSEFQPDQYAHIAKLLRSDNEALVRAALSNNINVIIAALDIAAKSEPVDEDDGDSRSVRWEGGYY